MDTVSVVIPTYNRANLLSGAIDSVLKQTHDQIELIIVDDNSTDRTKEVVESYDDSRISYYRHETNKGGSAARNTGIRLAGGRYIAFLDSDDKWAPNKLEKQINRLKNTEDECTAVHCDVKHSTNVSGTIEQIFSKLSYDHSPAGSEELIPRLLSGNLKFHGTSTLFVELESVSEINGFSEGFNRHQDIEFLTRLLKVGCISYIDEPLVEKKQTGMLSRFEYLKPA